MNDKKIKIAEKEITKAIKKYFKRSYYSHAEDFKDIQQSILLNICINYKNYIYTTLDKYQAWVYTISKNYCINQTRKYKKDNEIKKIYYYQYYLKRLAETDKNTNLKEMCKILKTKTKELPKKYQEIFEHYFLQNGTIKNTSKHFNISLETTKQRIRRTKFLLLKKLKSKTYKEFITKNS